MKFRGIDTKQTLAVGVWACLAGAVLAFGGVEPLSWSAVNLLALLVFGFVLWHTRAQIPVPRLPWKGTLLLLGYVGVQAALVHPDRHLVRQEILRLLACLCVFYVSLFVSGSEKSRGVLLAGLFSLGLFESLYGLVQYVSGWQHIFTYKKVFYTAQATGTYINPNHFAGLLEMILPFFLARTLYSLESIGQATANRQHAPKRFASSEGFAALVFIFFSCLLLFAAILFSGSRAGILSASGAVIATSILWVSSSRPRPRATLAVICLLVEACLFSLWIGLAPVVERYERIGTDYSSRLAVWKDSIALIRAHPLRGSGLGSFADAYTRVQSTLLSGVVDHAHNDYLELAVEWGIPGVGLLMGLIVWILARTVRACFHLKQPTVRFLSLGCCGSIFSLLLHSVADFNLQIPANALTLATVLGVAYSTSAGEPVQPSE